ncbi:pyridoxal-phosphate dependent enzyme [Panacibacter ginsenosidivorans]|uniref:Pyridoxal-phosphate dependent enzyme n=2 Tax=Panacibacter ginsenosidivorans TaxID=1813871 RepID=A0A5B8VGQ1_9BACT|nr:pyridoxal-phosphate dependent enzyme [Panacibacter ginsenosidivorans]
MEVSIHLEKIITQPIEVNWLHSNNTKLNVLRLDLIHPVISGNKWFKLKYYLATALANKSASIGTFGGAYSNHIVAVAYACKTSGINSIGIIRGEEPSVLSDTLLDAKHYGMKLHFVNRAAYRDTEIIKQHFEDTYWIEEGGYGTEGVKGAAEILAFAKNSQNYSHIICAVGTGTMMAGIIQSAQSHQTIIGISTMKGNFALHEKVKNLLDDKNQNNKYKIMHEYHFGGYAKHPSQLLQFMNETWQHQQLPTDIVYTAKAFYATKQMILENTIPKGSNVLMIHSGGLQGNRSLPDNTLLF